MRSRACPSGEIALAGSRRLRATLVAAPVLFTQAFVRCHVEQTQNSIAFFLVCSQSELAAVTRGCTMAPMTVTESKPPAFAIEAKTVARACQLPISKGKRAHEIQLAAQAQLAGVCLI